MENSAQEAGAAAAPVVIAVGSVMVDVVCRVPRLPRSGEGVVVDDVRMAVGGCALNSANAARQLGAAVELVVPVGSGPYADFARRELAARGFAGVEAPGMGDCGAAMCLVEPSGERSMITLPGVEREFRREWFTGVERAARAGLIACGFASGYELEPAGGDAIVDFFANHPQIEFWYAPGPRTCHIPAERVARINALRPVWHLNDQEALAYTGCASIGDAGRALAREAGNVAVITAGADGSYLFQGDAMLHVPTDPVDPLDTVGAGDAHLGALCAARTAGMPWADALPLANRLAAAVCLTPGATLADADFAKLGLHL